MGVKLKKKNYGNGRTVYCSRCKKVISKYAMYGNPNNPDYEKPRCPKQDNFLAKNCPFAEESHKYMSVIYNPITQKTDIRKEWPDIKDETEFVKAHADFRKELKANNYSTSPAPKPVTKPLLLVHCFADYLDYLNNQNVEEWEKTSRDKKYIQNTQRYIDTFLEVLQSNGLSVKRLLITDIKKEHWAFMYKYLQDYRKADGTPLSNASYDHHRGALDRMWNYFINFREYDLVNPFKTIKRKVVKKNVEGVDLLKFEMLIDAIKPDLSNAYSFKGAKKERVNNYRDFLKICYYAHLMIGDRPEGMVLLKWSHVKSNYIVIPNHKVNAQQNTEFYESVIPITKDIQELLMALGWAKYAGSEDYLLAPDWKSSRKSLQSLLSKSFTHYRKQLPFDDDFTIKSLRKTAGTTWAAKLGYDPFHERGNKVHSDHYRDREIEGQQLGSEYEKETIFSLKLSL